MTAPGAPGQKVRWRAEVRARRRARPEPERAAAARALARVALESPALAALPPGAVVAAYAASPTEPGTQPLRAALTARGLSVLLPVVAPGPGPLLWVDADGARVRSGLAGAAVVLVPALAVDRSGTRLGQGGGHYDRTLAALDPRDDGGPLLAAVVHGDELLDAGALPREAHDVPVHAALTPDGWTDLA